MFKVGDIVMLNEYIRDHDIVKFVEYEVVRVSAYGSLYLRNIQTNTPIDGGRDVGCFRLARGPW